MARGLQKRASEAVTELREARSCAPDVAIIRLNYGVALALAGTETACWHAHTSVTLTLWLCVVVVACAGDTSEALKQFRVATRLNRKLVSSHINQAAIFEGAQKAHKKAVKALTVVRVCVCVVAVL